MAYKFERYAKYEVLKLDDIRKYLDGDQKDTLAELTHTIQQARIKDGKRPCNSYVVVNEDQWYAETVWKLIEAGEILSHG